MSAAAARRQQRASLARALLLALTYLLLVSLGECQCMRAKHDDQDVAPMPRLRATANDTAPPDANKPAGCAMPMSLAINAGQLKKTLSLGISVRTGVGDSEEFETDSLDFMPGSQVNITVPIVACGETLIGVIMRVLGNKTSETLLVDRVSSTYMGGFQRSSTICGPEPFVLNKYKTLIELAPAV